MVLEASGPHFGTPRASLGQFFLLVQSLSALFVSLFFLASLLHFSLFEPLFSLLSSLFSLLSSLFSLRVSLRSLQRRGGFREATGIRRAAVTYVQRVTAYQTKACAA